MIRIEKTFFKEFLIMLVGYIVAYGIVFIPHYTSDTYYAIMSSDLYGIGNLALGRYGCEVVYAILRKFGIDYVKCFPYIMGLMIISFAYFATIVFRHIMRQYSKELSKIQIWMIRIGVALVLCNCFAQEWFAFWECGFQWIGSILFMGLAITQVDNQMNCKKIILSMFFLVLSLGFYQASLSIYLILGCSIIYIGNMGRLSKKSVIQTCIIIAMGGISSIINLLSIKLFQLLGMAGVTSRTESITLTGILKNVRYLFGFVCKLMVNTCGLYPKYLFLLMATILVFLIFFSFIRNKGENNLKNIIYVLILVLFCVASICIPHMFTTSIWLPQRTIVGFWGVLSMLILVLVTEEKKNGIIEKIGIIIAGIILVVNIVKIQELEVDLVVTNRIEEEISYVIHEKIETYEEKAGIKIEAVGLAYDESINLIYSTVKHFWCDTNKTAYATSWGYVNCINFYNGSAYYQIDMSEDVYNKYVKGKNWDCFNADEQLIFQDNVMYIIKY